MSWSAVASVPCAAGWDVRWHHDGIEVSKSPIHEAIVKAGFRKIYTTNFDRWIERACDHWRIGYHKVLTVNDLASVDRNNLEIVKFHGDFDDDKTLVLTETSYFNRLNFEAPMDLMLRADILRHPVLFIGYSLSDINVRYIFHKLSKTWEQVGLTSGRPNSYIFMSNPNPVEEKMFRKWGISPIVDATGSPQEGLLNFLRALPKDPSLAIDPPDR